jgi:ornithine carbamoyltransferase
MEAVIASAAKSMPRHFLDLDRLSATELRRILDQALHWKTTLDRSMPLKGKILAMIFEKPSTRTRLSFEVAMKQLGGDVITLSASDSQISRGETIADTARVLSR